MYAIQKGYNGSANDKKVNLLIMNGILLIFIFRMNQKIKNY